VKSTPTLFVNGRKIEGVPTWESLRQAIDQATALVPVPGARGL
jgi:protein-disulfide isomerase